MSRIDDTITEGELIFAQDPHACAPSANCGVLKVMMRDAGGGPYIVISAEQFAANDVESLCALIREAYALLKRGYNLELNDIEQGGAR